MLKRIALWPPSEEWPTWWVLYVMARVSWFGARLASDTLLLQMLVAGAIVSALWPLGMAFTRWLRARLSDDSGGDQACRRSEGSVG